MSTSLKEQLEKLAVPQSSAITRGKKRPSIFFKPKDAAEQSRETMYEIGMCGLEELIKRNSSFEEFRNTLFHESYKNFERSVHDVSTNEKLDKIIRRFFLYLSPYFALRDACMALEWLIYRYNIHEYNRNDFVMMILPYHETNMFVRALQVVTIKSENDNFSWLKKLQRNGVHLAKTVLYNHAMSNPAFIKNISSYLLAAVKLHDQPNHLNVLFNFYCLTFCGAIQHAENIDDRHITSMMPALLKGLKSDIPDYLAGSLLIVSKLVSKIALTEKLLNKFVENISCFNVRILQESSVMALLKIYQTQEDFKKITPAAIKNFSTQMWLPKVLEKFNEKYSVEPFLDVLLKGILELVLASEDTKEMEKLLTTLLNEVKFGENTVSCLISEIYKSKITTDKAESWIKSLILSIETKYPTIFDREINKILNVSTQERSSKKQKRFRSLLMATTGLSNTEILQQLYHPAGSIRKEGIKYLMVNSSNLKQRGQVFLRDALLERLNDDNPSVVIEALKCSKKFISDLFENEILVETLVKLLYKCQENRVEWRKVFKLTLSIICSISKDDNVLVFVSILSYLLPVDNSQLNIAKTIVGSEYFQNSKMFSHIQHELITTQDSKKFTSLILNTISESRMDIVTLIESLKQISTNNYNTLNKYLSSLLLCSTLPNKSPVKLAFLILEIMITYLEDSKLEYASKFETLASGVELSRNNKFPLQGFLKFIEILVEKCDKTDLSVYDFSRDIPETRFYICVLGILLKGCCSATEEISIAYASTLKNILNHYCSDFEIKINTFMNIVIADNTEIDDVLRLRCLRTIHSMLNNTFTQARVSSNFLPYLLICLANSKKEIRATAMNIIEILLLGKAQLIKTYFLFIKNITQYKEGIILDSNEIPRVFNIISKKKNEAFKKALRFLIDTLNKTRNRVYIKIGIGTLFIHNDDLEIYNNLCEISLHILNKNVNNNYSLNAYESQFVSNVINKLNSGIAQKLESNMNIIKLFSFGIESDKYILDLDNEKVLLPLIVMDKIDRDIFESFEENLKTLMLNKIIEVSTTSENSDVVTAAKKIFKHIDLESKLIIDYLIKMRDVQSPKIDESKRKRRISIVPTVDILDTLDWKRGLTILECIHDKKKIRNPSALLPVLFGILKKCLDFDEQGNVEYPKQLILSSILNTCKRMEDLEHLSENVFNIETIVQCIRASQNPQTHHEALSVLAHTAQLIPHQVLHHIMAIFTFMGSSVLRYDDAYSFQIIHKIIDTILPILVANNEQENIVKVLRVFVDTILDVPEHRRMTLYKNLLETIDVNENLYIFLLLMCESHVIHANTEKQKVKYATRGELAIPKRLDIAADIARLFSTDIVISTCSKLIKYLETLPEQKDDLPEKILIDIKHFSPIRFRHYKYVILTFISSLLSSKEFVEYVANLSDETLLQLEPIYKATIINILTYIQVIAKTSDRNIDTPQMQYWKVMLHHSYDVLDSVNALLTPQMFLLVIRGLSTHNLLTVRRRALELLNSKLQHDSSFFQHCTENELHAMIPCLINIIKQIESNVPSEIEVIIQTSLLSLKLFIKLLAPNNPETFVPVLDFITIVIKSGHAKGNILASMILCLAELCTQLRAHAISNLPKFVPVLIKLLKSHKHQETPDLLLLSTVTAIQKVFETLPLFLSSYLEKLLFQLSLVTAKWIDNGDQKLQPFLTKLNSIKLKIGTSIPIRVLIPAVEGCYKNIIETSSYNGIGPLMEILAEKVQNSENNDIQSNLNELVSFFMSALQFRSEKLESLEETNIIESHIIKAFVAVILKLSESTFRPIYYKVYDWAVRSDIKTERIITFYALSSEVANCLKGLFVLFASHFLNNAASILDLCNVLKQKETYFEDDEQKTLLLLEYVLKTLGAVFLYDSQRFINKERFDVLMQPIVDQLENNIGGEDSLVSRVSKLVTPAIVHFAVATGDDALWKQLNYQILLKMRHTSAKIRLCSLKCVLELSRKLGEEFLPLLPETIPFLAELLEDEEEEVEKTCQRTVQEMEKILGEPLQKYF